MHKGVSIFYEYHEQGSPHVIAGIYSSTYKSEEDMRTVLLSLMGYDKFHERDQPTYINHMHIYANSLLGNEIDKDTKYTLSRFFPEALDGFLPLESFKFEYRGTGAYEFIWNNHYRKELQDYRVSLQKEGAERYQAARAEKKRLEREEAKRTNNEGD